MNVQRIAPPRSLVQRAKDAVTAHIRDHGLRVGDTLPGEGHFAEKLGVSRAVMREAFGAMAALGLIDVANGRKPRVGALDGNVIAASLDHAISTAQISVSQVWDVRRTIEVRTAALAAANASKAEADHIVALAEAMTIEEAEDGPVTDHDIEFHQAIARASGNALFEQIVMSFAPLMKVAVQQAWQTRRTEEEKKTILERHRALAKAIADRDPAAASYYMDLHFDESVGLLLQKLPPGAH